MERFFEYERMMRLVLHYWAGLVTLNYIQITFYILREVSGQSPFLNYGNHVLYFFVYNYTLIIFRKQMSFYYRTW
mgnify:CR=1 FL=1